MLSLDILFSKDYFSVLIPSFVTIVGFILTYYLAQRTIKAEISKMKKARMIENGIEILDFFTDVLNGAGNSISVDEIKQIRKKIISYGSKELIIIYSSYQQFTYKMSNTSTNEDDKKEMFAYIGLLVSQLKYDITGETINPSYYFKMVINEFYDKENFFSDVDKKVNEINNRLNLNLKIR